MQGIAVPCVSPMSCVGGMSSGSITDKEIRRESIKKDPIKRKRKGVKKPPFSHCGPRNERSPRFGVSLVLEGENITIEYL